MHCAILSKGLGSLEHPWILVSCYPQGSWNQSPAHSKGGWYGNAKIMATLKMNELYLQLYLYILTQILKKNTLPPQVLYVQKKIIEKVEKYCQVSPTMFSAFLDQLLTPPHFQLSSWFLIPRGSLAYSLPLLPPPSSSHYLRAGLYHLAVPYHTVLSKWLFDLRDP